MFDAEIGLDQGEHISIYVKQPQGYVVVDISLDLKDGIHIDIGHNKKSWDIGCFRVIEGKICGSIPIPPCDHPCENYFNGVGCECTRQYKEEQHDTR